MARLAPYKRAPQVPIREFAREREILADRSRRASGLGLSPELVESLFRLILRGSRDRQAALKAEVPMDIQQRTVAIIGGRGGMGRCMAQLFGDLGHAVMIADLDTDLTPAEAASAADVVVISVPIDRTIEVVNAIGPKVRRDALLLDVTSIKQPIVEAMLGATESAVVGTHPLFGPTVHSVQGQRVVLCRGRGDERVAWLSTLFHARGVVLQEATP